MDSRLNKAQLEAKAYVELHQVERLAGEMLNAVVHAKPPHPVLFMINYLKNLIPKEEMARAGLLSTHIQAFPEIPATSPEILKRHLIEPLWQAQTHKSTSHGFTVVDLVNLAPEASIGLVAKDPECYSTFSDVLSPVLYELHGTSPYMKGFDFQGLDHDPEAVFVRSSRVRFSRNLKGRKFVPGLTLEEKVEIEEMFKLTFQKLPGQYISLATADQRLLKNLSLHFPKVPHIKQGDYAKSNSDWPQGRGVFISNDNNLYAWVNVREHLEVFAVDYGADVPSLAKKALQLLKSCEKHLKFEFDSRLGYLNSNLGEIGSAMQLTVQAKLPLVAAAQEEFPKWLAHKRIRCINIDTDKRTNGRLLELQALTRIGKTEAQVLWDFSQAIEELLDWETRKQKEHFPVWQAGSKMLISRVLTQEIWNRYNQARLDETSFYRLIQAGAENPHSKIGVFAPSASAFTTYQELMDKMVTRYHRFSLDGSQTHNFETSRLELPSIEGNLIESTRVRVSRNLKGLPLVSSLSRQQRQQVELSIKTVFETLEGEFSGTYNSLESMEETKRTELVASHLMFENPNSINESAGLARHWPEGRGLYLSHDKQFSAWVNEEDHLRLISMSEGESLLEVFRRLVRGLEIFERSLQFAEDSRLGYINSCISNLGSALRASFHVRLVKVSKQPDFKSFCKSRGLQIRSVKGENFEPTEPTFDISFSKPLGFTEVEAITKLHHGVGELVQWERRLV
jgi:creatine kinase/arginine kinase